MKELDYRIGLDIGTNSVGWGVIEMRFNEGKQRYEKIGIVDTGVRMFDKAESPKTGASLAEPRRLARSSRKRLNRRSLRKKEIKNMLVTYGVIDQTELNKLYPLSKGTVDVWDLRLDALDRLLNRVEWARLLIHLSQRRGFQSNRKSESKEPETGQVLSSVKENKQKLSSYRTVGEMWMVDPKFSECDKRHNSTNEYLFSVGRKDLVQEIVTLFELQRQFRSEHATEEFQEEYLKIWGHQLPFASGNQVLKKVGYCSLDPLERRIPKATYTFQYFSALDQINKTRVGSNFEPFTAEQRDILLDRLFNRTDYFERKAIPSVKYYDIRMWLNLDEAIQFKGLTYDPSEKLSKIEAKDFTNLKPYYEIRKVITKYSTSSVNRYTSEDYDTIGFALTIYKTDKDIRAYLKNSQNQAKRVYEENLIEALLDLSYSKFGHLSAKVIQQLSPVMLKGQTFKDAADQLNFDTTGLKKGKRDKFLPVISDDITNPIVKRTLSQTRKLVNAIIKRYGSPLTVHIELARELSKDRDERNKMTKAQEENRKRNKGAIQILVENGILNPTGHDIVRYKLWKEQGERCAYSLRLIPPDTFFHELRRERGSTPSLDVDHILPYSQSFMDSYINKVLVYSDENRKKGNRIPYDYLRGSEGRWESFEEYVQSNAFSKKKRGFLLRKEFTPRESDFMKERHLVDTRYATRFFKNFVEQQLVFKESRDPEQKKRVYTVNGIITAHFRKRWGLEKAREETHLHHAMDGIVVACTDQHMVTRVTEYYKQKEKVTTMKQPYFPWPWEGFRDDLLSRLALQPVPSEIKKGLQKKHPLPKYMLVSRMPKRSITGAAHRDTIMMKGGTDEKGKTLIVKRVPIKDIKFDKDGDFKMVGKEQDPATYEAIKQRYLEYGGDITKAFEKELYKPSKKGQGNPIRMIKVMDKAMTSVREVNGGVAKNGDLVRIDVFQRDGKYYAVPIYVMDTSLPELPNKVMTTGKGYDQWNTLDESYEFQFSLHSNDLVRLKKDDEDRYLYFSSVGNDANRLYFKDVNRPSEQTDFRYTLSKIELLEKYEVGILGELSLVKQETRRSFK